jgi:hypothetical protein
MFQMVLTIGPATNTGEFGFQIEFRTFLRRYAIQYDECYVWD